MYKKDLLLKIDNSWNAIKPNQTKSYIFNISYLPTPPLGQDMTQGQFLSGV